MSKPESLTEDKSLPPSRTVETEPEELEETEIEQRILHRLGAMHAKRVLDVGCGEGRLVNLLAGQTGQRVVGLDISDHGFAEARYPAGQTASPHLVECVECDAQRIAFKGDHFEAVILTYSLHHVEEPLIALREIHRILKPGGRVLIGDWVAAEDQSRSGCFRFTLPEMRQMPQAAGFQRVEVEQIEPGLVLVVGEKERQA